jgi:hypothetical protein
MPAGCGKLNQRYTNPVACVSIMHAQTHVLLRPQQLACMHEPGRAHAKVAVPPEVATTHGPALPDKWLPTQHCSSHSAMNAHAHPGTRTWCGWGCSRKAWHAGKMVKGGCQCLESLLQGLCQKSAGHLAGEPGGESLNTSNLSGLLH